MLPVGQGVERREERLRFGADVGDGHLDEDVLALRGLLQIGELRVGDDGGPLDSGDDELEVAVADRLADAVRLVLQRRRLTPVSLAGRVFLRDDRRLRWTVVSPTRSSPSPTRRRRETIAHRLMTFRRPRPYDAEQGDRAEDAGDVRSAPSK